MQEKLWLCAADRRAIGVASIRATASPASGRCFRQLPGSPSAKLDYGSGAPEVGWIQRRFLLVIPAQVVSCMEGIGLVN